MTSANAGQFVDASRLIRLCDLEDLDEDEPSRAEVDGFAYAIFKVGDMVFVTADLCSHGPGLLSEGYVEDCQVECPFHQGKFDIRTGMPTEAPCEIPIKTWTPVLQDGGVYINPGEPNPN
ncbi:non-heme iron oxygenase ferredoxin subunit [Pelagibacterium sp.]|uniref:non-heme iron oxygenase ferredoxin subunit n=1 Tax=Pelagibacterium sp. TaxID=1967288 RepID=UPI003BAACDA8